MDVRPALHSFMKNEEGYTESPMTVLVGRKKSKPSLRYNANKGTHEPGTKIHSSQIQLMMSTQSLWTVFQQELPTTTSSLKSEMVTLLGEVEAMQTMTTTTVWTNVIYFIAITNIMVCLNNHDIFFLFYFCFKLIDWILYDKIVIEIEVITMLKQEKLDNILETVNTKGTITVKEIMTRLDVSDMTVRTLLARVGRQGFTCSSTMGAEKIRTGSHFKQWTFQYRKTKLTNRRKTKKLAVLQAISIDEG